MRSSVPYEGKQLIIVLDIPNDLRLASGALPTTLNNTNQH